MERSTRTIHTRRGLFVSFGVILHRLMNSYRVNVSRPVGGADALLLIFWTAIELDANA